MKTKLFFISILFTLQAFSQSMNGLSDNCVSKETEQLNREIQAAFQQLKNSSHYAAWRAGGGPITVPIVIHVVNNDIYVAQYSSDSTLIRMIDRLNIYYAKQNADTATIPAAFQPLAAASRIHFCFAATDPLGNATSGIVRVPSSHGPFYSTQDNELTSTALGGDDPWPYSAYLNIYVCGTDAGHLGFATHGHACVSYIALSSTTLPHEVGHAFGLSHTWGFGPPYTCSDDDGISDTPLQWGPSSGTPAYPHYDSCTTAGDGILFMDMMDYAQQRTMFTTEQVALMEYTLTTNSDYIAMIATNNCSTVGVETVSSESLFSISPVPATDEITLTIAYPQRGEKISVNIYDGLGRVVFSNESTGKPTLHLDVSALPAGIYFVKVGAGGRVSTKKLVIE